MASWRKGLRWDKGAGGWRVVRTGRVLTPVGLKRRKSKAKREEKKEPESPKEKAYERMQAAVKKAEQELDAEGYVVDSRIHRNADGTVDAELRVKPKRGQQVNDIFIDIELASRAVPNTWVSTGIRYKPRETEQFYARFMGMSQANTNYQRNTPNKLATNFVTARQINDNMQARGRKKPEQVFLRLHWNSENKQPERNQ